MIQSLRKKFVLVSMTLVSLVLLGVLAGICLYYSAMLRQDSYRALEMALERPRGYRGPNFQIGGNVPDDFQGLPVFVVTANDDGGVSIQISEFMDVDEAELNKIILEVYDRGLSRGELKKYDLRYVAVRRANETRIAFMPLSLEKARLLNIFLVTSLVMIGAIIVFLLASILLSRWALSPAERAWQKQRRFVADASHELKTPLTIILANAGIMKSHPEETISQQMCWIENTESEARRMKELVDDLLFLAKGDDMTVSETLIPIKLSDAVSASALAFESVAFENGFELKTEIEPEIELRGNEQQIKQLVGILIDNAIKYGNKGSVIQLCLRKKQNTAELLVYNEGEQIDAETIKHLFERFYRADPSRTQQGYGLGLSIASAIAKTHHGKITAENKNQGTIFYVSLPTK